MAFKLHPASSTLLLALALIELRNIYLLSIATFLGENMSLPYVVSIGDDTAFLGYRVEAAKTPFVVLGVPYDETASYRAGARWGPLAIRKISRSLEACSLLTGIDMESIGFHDVGNVVPELGNTRGTLDKLRNVAEALLKQRKRLFVFGGEHTITYGTYAALSSVYSSKHCLVVFDAHLDMRDSLFGSKLNHATVIRRIVEDLNPSKLLYIGVRAFSSEEAKYVSKLVRQGLAEVVYAVNIHRSLPQYAKQFREMLSGCDELYISIDMDVFDPAYAPAVQTPEPLGLSTWQFFDIIMTLVDSRVHIVDIVELAPTYDIGEATSALAARIVIEMAALISRDLRLGKLCAEDLNQNG